MIQFVHYGSDLLVCDRGKARSLGKIVAEQAIGVFDEATLPRRIGVGKEKGGLQVYVMRA